MKNSIRVIFIAVFMYGDVYLFSIIPGVPSTPGVYTSYEDTTANNDINAFQTSVFSALTTGATKESIAALGDTFSNIITPLLTNVPYSLETLINAENRTVNFISALTSLKTNLPSSDARSSAITSQLSKLNTQRSNLNKRLTDQQTISNTMITIRNLPIDTNFRTRVNKLGGLVINKNTLDALKTSYLNDINDLLTYAQSKGTQEQAEVRSLISGVMNKFKSQIYTTKDQQDQSPIFQQLEQLQAKATQSAPTVAAPTAIPAIGIPATPQPMPTIQVMAEPTAMLPPTHAPAQVTPATPLPAVSAPTPPPTAQLTPIQTKIEDIKKRTLLSEKLSIAKELLNMIKEETSSDDRKNVFSLFKDIEAGFLKMSKADIELLLAFLKDNLKANSFMADFVKDIDGLITELAEAKEQAGDTGTLLGSLKTKIASFSTNTSAALDAALYALKLLDQGKLPPEEQKLEQPGAAKQPASTTPSPAITTPVAAPLTTSPSPTPSIASGPAPTATDPQSLTIATLLGLNAQYYYNNRFDKIVAMGTDPEKRTAAFEQNILSDFKKMLQLFEKAKTQPLFSTLLATRKFGDRAIDALTLTIKILEVKASSPEKQVEAFPQLLATFMDLFTKYKEFSMDLRAEKSLFMNAITDFINNSNRATPESLQKLKTFLLNAPTIAFKESTQDSPFNNKDREKFETWLPKIETAIRLAETNQALMALDSKPKAQTSLSWHRARVRRLSSSTSLRPSSSCMR